MADSDGPQPSGCINVARRWYPKSLSCSKTSGVPEAHALENIDAPETEDAEGRKAAVRLKTARVRTGASGREPSTVSSVALVNMKTIALIGAGGKMGCRLTDNFLKTNTVHSKVPPGNTTCAAKSHPSHQAKAVPSAEW